MTPTTNRRATTPGARERLKAHMQSITAKRTAVSYHMTENDQGEIALSDTDLEERVTILENNAERVKGLFETQNEKLNEIIAGLQASTERIAALATARIQLDETAIEQITTHMEAAFLRASQGSVERHAEFIRDRLMENLGEGLEAIAPKGSGVQKLASVMSIVGGCIVTAMAGTYAYAVFNYTPPQVGLKIDGSGISAVGTGGEAIAA